MKTIHYPSQCISDYNFIKGFCPTPKYLKPKPKKHRKFECPTIITTNPEELHHIPQQFPEDFYDFLNDPQFNNDVNSFDEEIKIKEDSTSYENEPEDHAEPIP